MNNYNSFLSFWRPASRRVCLPFAIVGNYVAELPHALSGVVSLSRHRNEEEPSPHIGVDSAAQISWQSHALGHADMCNCPVSGSHNKNSWRSINNTRCHALVGQGHAGSPTDTTHPTQHKMVVSKRREKHSYFASLKNEILGLLTNQRWHGTISVDEN